MSHSTGSESRLHRLKPGQSFGSAEYAREELVDVKRSASYIGQRVDAMKMRIERDGVNADFSDIRSHQESAASRSVKQQNSAEWLTPVQREYLRMSSKDFQTHVRSSPQFQRWQEKFQKWKEETQL